MLTAFKRNRVFRREEAGRRPQHQKDRHGFEAVEINGRIHAEDKVRAEKEARSEKINWQEDWNENEENCDTAFDIWQKVTARKVKEKCELDVNVRTVQRTLHRIGLKYAKAKKKITLTKKHKGARLECAKRWLTMHVDFKAVIFSDEKRFKFDGPDGWCTWSRRGEPVVLNKRQIGGGGVSVLGMIFANGNISSEWLKGGQNSESYKQLLDEKALPRIRREIGNDFVLQQDNCSIHVSKLMKEWMAKVNMTTLEWPVRSPDLNLIENIWEMLAQLVHDGPEIMKEAQLWERILGAKKQLIETHRDVIVNMFDHYEEVIY